MSKKRSTTRVHEAKAELKNVPLVKAGSALKLAIYADKEKLGEMHIGRGGMFWWGHKRKTRRRIDWTRFASKMDELAYG